MSTTLRARLLIGCLIAVACSGSDENGSPGGTGGSGATGGNGGAGGGDAGMGGDGSGAGGGAPARCAPSPLQLVDDNSGTDPDMYRHDIAVDGGGNVYSAVSSGQRVFVRVSSDGGLTWTPTADVPYGTDRGRVVVDFANDVLYVATVGDDANANRRGVLFRSVAPYSSWTLLDEFPRTALFDIHVMPAGDIFLVGRGPDGTAADGWLVRGGIEGGTFATVDHTPGTGALDDDTRADALASDDAGNLFVAGLVYDGNNLVWTVRKSANGGVDWQDVDTYESTPNTWALAVGITVADDQSLIVAGEAGEDVAGPILNRWLIRKSPAGGAAWNTLHRLPAIGGPEIFVARDVAAGEGDRLYAVGYQGSANDMSSQLVFASSADAGGSFELTTVPFSFVMDSGLIAARIVVGSDGIVYLSQSDAIRAACPE